MKRTMRFEIFILLLLLSVVLLSGCAKPVTSASIQSTTYTAPEFAGVSFNTSAAEGENGVLIDLSSVSLGYVSASVQADANLKFQVIYGDTTYNYDLPSDGTPTSFALQSGSGLYSFRVMQNTSGNKYIELYQTNADVSLLDEFQPFLRPSQYVEYNESSACVLKAQELSVGASDQLDVVSAVFKYITDNIDYDQEKAETVQSGYLSSPDETLSSGKGICFDYAALAAAMLRSEGIPTKMIFGYVSGNIYHAWNMFYTDETGWVAVKYEVVGSTWKRIDLTFSAGGVDEDFVENNSNYTDLYVY